MLSINSRSVKQPHIQASLFMLVSGVFVAFNNLFGQQMLLTFTLPIVLFLRYLLPAIILWAIAYATSIPRLEMSAIKPHLIRMLLGLLSQYALFYYLKHGSLLDATLLFMTSPLFVPLITRIFNKTPMKKKHWMSLTLGFLGVLCFFRPDYTLFNWAALIGLLSGLLNACSQVSLHRLVEKNSVSGCTLWMYTFSSLAALIPAIIFFHPITLRGAHLARLSDMALFITCIGLAVTSIGNKSLRACAFSKAKNPGSLTPLLYFSIIVSGMLDWLVYHKTPSMVSIIGACLIVSSAIILVEHKKEVSQ